MINLNFDFKKNAEIKKKPIFNMVNLDIKLEDEIEPEKIIDNSQHLL